MAKRGDDPGVLGGGETWLNFRSSKTKQLHVRPKRNSFTSDQLATTSITTRRRRRRLCKSRRQPPEIQRDTWHLTGRQSVVTSSTSRVTTGTDVDANSANCYCDTTGGACCLCRIPLTSMSWWTYAWWNPTPTLWVLTNTAIVGRRLLDKPRRSR